MAILRSTTVSYASKTFQGVRRLGQASINLRARVAGAVKESSSLISAALLTPGSSLPGNSSSPTGLPTKGIALRYERTDPGRTRPTILVLLESSTAFFLASISKVIPSLNLEGVTRSQHPSNAIGRRISGTSFLTCC